MPHQVRNNVIKIMALASQIQAVEELRKILWNLEAFKNETGITIARILW